MGHSLQTHLMGYEGTFDDFNDRVIQVLTSSLSCHLTSPPHAVSRVLTRHHLNSSRRVTRADAITPCRAC
jgi:hypothetical protein